MCLVLPCLMLGYMGQAAYLMENHADASQAFFSSVPGKVHLISSVSYIHAFLANKTTAKPFSMLQVTNVFYILVLVIDSSYCSTGAAFWPVLFIANVAALIASRTMTTATFSCIKQSTALGCFPRLKIIHTSRKFMGQIYIPVLNWFLLAVCLVVVCSISSINEIGNAYGNSCFLCFLCFISLKHRWSDIELSISQGWLSLE